jgi:DNA primase
VAALALSDNAVEVNTYVARLAQTLTLDEAAVRSELRKHVRMSQKDKSVNRGQNSSTAMMENRTNMATIMAERHIIRMLLTIRSLVRKFLLILLMKTCKTQIGVR